MPLVVISRNPEVVDDYNLAALTSKITWIVAKALNIPNSPFVLTKYDIEVWTRDTGVFDQGTKDLEIIIFANFYPERAQNLDARQVVITEEVKKILGKQYSAEKKKPKGFVWVLLQPASFGEF